MSILDAVAASTVPLYPREDDAFSIKVEPEAEKMKKPPFAHRPSRMRALALRGPSPAALGASATGSKREPPRCL